MVVRYLCSCCFSSQKWSKHKVQIPWLQDPLPSVDMLVVNEKQNKDYIRGEKRILIEMRPEVPFASSRVFSEPLHQTLA